MGKFIYSKFLHCIKIVVAATLKSGRDSEDLLLTGSKEI
jgi:hypothetical protein